MPDKVKKYYFDFNIFDEDHIEDVEPQVPPPPSFTTEEVDAARQESFERGKQEGLLESKASREQYVASVLDSIAQSVPKLFKAESLREKTYEREALALALEAFSTLFPWLDSRYGLDETRATIVTVLEDTEGKSSLVVEVHPDALEGIEAHIDSIRGRLGAATVEVRSLEGCGRGDCRIFWKDGGAVRDATSLAAKIKNIMEERLAGASGKVHNDRGLMDSVDPSVPPSSAASSTDQGV